MLVGKTVHITQKLGFYFVHPYKLFFIALAVQHFGMLDCFSYGHSGELAGDMEG